jgi:hypothetical protein
MTTPFPNIRPLSIRSEEVGTEDLVSSMNTSSEVSRGRGRPGTSGLLSRYLECLAFFSLSLIPARRM